MFTSEILERKKVDAVLITKPENIKYLSGFSGSFGQILMTQRKDYLITDSRYKLEAERQCYPEIKIVIIEDYEKDVIKLLKDNKIKEIGFEDKNLSFSAYKKMKSIFSPIKFKPIDSILDHERTIKTPAEIMNMRKSQIINEKTLTEAIRCLKKSGITEAELAWKIHVIGHDFGAEDISFEPIVAFGSNSASPHHSPTQRKYKKGEIVLIDMGMKYKGYCSDMTRTFIPTNAPTQMVSHYNIVLEAQNNCISKISAGKTGETADKLARKIIEKYGMKDYFTHSSGHGIGLEIHEAPSLSFKSKHKDKAMKLQENMVVTVEPGIYIENKYGIRIEDMIVISASGEQNVNLTAFPKNIESIIIK
jgi:Xaa-Pro aminopeptidase